TMCCCGNDDCAFQQQNNEAFASLDENLRKAGRLGKALLVRHEAYVAEAEEQKALMDAEITRMTEEKKELEANNATLIEENRNLLDQLEGLNNAAVESDAHTQSLTATLQQTQAELHRLNTLAARTERLEREVEEYEQEQAILHATLAHKTESEKAATLRWQDAERKLAAMESQLERIEREAREDKERHVEIVARMERQRVVEKELDTVPGRLNGAAAAKTAKHGSTVVSHFVKDILSDNVNLQAGIAELREMLDNSNEQVEILRNQLAQYTPTDMTSDIESPAPSLRPNLEKEIKRASMQQEVHVHHHYHAPAEHSRKASLTLRRPKKKRNVVSAYTRPTILDEDIYTRPRHRRAASHESLISVSGMDIHTLQSRPSQLLTAQSSRSFSSQASVTATLSLAHAARPATPPRGLGQRVGGWVFGKWGSTPTPTVTVSAPMDQIKVKQKRLSTSATKLRPPGINQAGPIFGFGPEPQLPREPILRTLNEEEL
ncbi:uncharacterized protein M437DRAFT_11199, partial [Aureobasidium melanogenum CBS 110374]